jgi:hypothetical protein
MNRKQETERIVILGSLLCLIPIFYEYTIKFDYMT